MCVCACVCCTVPCVFLCRVETRSLTAPRASLLQLEKALHLTPANYTIWFDIALAQLAQGVVAISSKVKVPSVPAVNTAMASLAAASKTFAFLRDSAKSESELGFKKAKAGAHVNSCEGRPTRDLPMSPAKNVRRSRNFPNALPTHGGSRVFQAS